MQDVAPQDIVRALAGDSICLPRAPSSGAAGGYGTEPVVQLDVVLLFLCHCCSGSLGAKLHMAFWTLDREERGLLGLEQVGAGAAAAAAAAAAAGHHSLDQPVVCVAVVGCGVR
jgi:hypothetical protein